MDGSRSDMRTGRLSGRVGQFVLNRAIATHNRFLAPAKRSRGVQTSDVPPLQEIHARAASTASDIGDHLATLFIESVELKPHLIVELGVRGGESTYVFERVARHTGARLVSVDISDCSDASDLSEWFFIQGDDIEVGLDFPAFCQREGLPGSIDALFIDTSHLYEHTKREIDVWFSHLSPRCKVFFHDTNLCRVYRRRDGTIGGGWDNDRGVIRAIEEYLGLSFDERRDFETIWSGWTITHRRGSNGLTILERPPTVTEGGP